MLTVVGEPTTALRGLELKTLGPYLSGWRMRAVPALGHLAVRMITNGVVDRTVQNWLADEHSRSTVKNTIAALVRVMEQRAPRTALAAEPDRDDPLTSVKGAGPQPVPKNDQGPVSDLSETGPDLRLSPVGTTGFEPATP
ncbi:hypothetical protein ACIRL0_01310 [Streptomyces sp. NPDC102365]|uniref:hypothetical protein n=1 Tax=Streptomyces sp. NPDC102365 TaxID=3366162 RepID=UPI00381ACE26